MGRLTFDDLARADGTISGRGSSPCERFAQLVERLPAVHRSNAADAMFLTFEARYRRPSEPD